MLDVKETVLRYALASVELTFMEAQVSPASRMEGRGREHPKSRSANGREAEGVPPREWKGGQEHPESRPANGGHESG